MPVAKKKNVQSKVITVIKRFKFDELEDAVLPVFPELSWDSIKSKLAKNHESFTTSHVVSIIDKQLKEKNFDDKTFEARLALLETVDISRHHKKKLWHAIELKGNPSIDMTSIQEIEEKIEQICKTRMTPTQVYAVEYNGVIFVSMKDKPSKKQKRTIVPIYFCLVPNELFCFGGQKNTPKSSIEALVEALGSTRGRIIKLIGKDVFALKQMLINRKENLVNGKFAYRPREKLHHAPPIETPLGYDFTQHKQRKLHADKYFGEKSPSFEFLKVRVLDQPWYHEAARQQLPDEHLATGVEFRSPNIPVLLKHLTEQGIMTLPLPTYAANIITLGRNNIDVKPYE